MDINLISKEVHVVSSVGWVLLATFQDNQPKGKHGSKSSASLEDLRRMSIFKLQMIEIGGSLTGNAHFDASTCVVSSPWLRSVYWGSCKTFRLRRPEGAKIRGSLVRNAFF